MEASCGTGLLGQGVAKRGAQRWSRILRLEVSWPGVVSLGTEKKVWICEIFQEGENKAKGRWERAGRGKGGRLAPGNKSGSPANPSGSSVANGPS